MKIYYVYILASKSKTLYIGMTNNLERRFYEHKKKLIPGYTKKYNVNRLMYFEETDQVSTAIAREKQLKGWKRQRKIDLIESVNPEWKDISADWYS